MILLFHLSFNVYMVTLVDIVHNRIAHHIFRHMNVSSLIGYYNHMPRCPYVSVGMPLCRRFFDLSDTALCAIGIVSKILGLIWLVFTVNKGMLFIGTLYSCCQHPSVWSQAQGETRVRNVALCCTVFYHKFNWNLLSGLICETRTRAKKSLLGRS